MKNTISGNGLWTFSITKMGRNIDGERVPVGDIPISNEEDVHLCRVEDYDIVAEFQSSGQGFTFKATVQEFEILKD